MALSRRELMVTTGALYISGQVAAVAAPLNDKPKLSPELVPPEAGAILLDDAWRFHLGDVPLPIPLGHRDSYDSVKAGNALGAAARTFDDFDWQLVDLPHDWAIFSTPSPKESLAQGYRHRGVSWYRRNFRLDKSLKGQYLEIQFEGIATNATIWFNGNLVAHNWSSYTSVYIDISTLAEFGDALNTLAVRVDANDIEGWWYEGAGIYRHTWLIVRSPVHLTTDGVYYDPVRDPAGSWAVPVEAAVYSIADASTNISVEAALLDKSGRELAKAETAAVALSLAETLVRLRLADFTPLLWSVDAPNLYDLQITVSANGKVLEQRVLSCGFRDFVFDVDKGLIFNGKPLKIKGACIHQDHAGVGVAVPDALVVWRMEQLKAYGINAIRSSHNPPSLALLNACDTLGILVLDENRHFSDDPEHLAQLTWMVKRDRNRPSVILYSIFNEEPLEGTEVGFRIARHLAHTIKTLDSRRPVTAALSGGLLSHPSVAEIIDVVGFNYQQNLYDDFHAKNPTKPIISSEDTSGFMNRGVWKTDRDHQNMASNDEEAAVWGGTQRKSWKEIETRPFVAGGFMWTGFDYGGEPTPFTWPANSSLFGLLDLCGFPKAAAFIRQSLWTHDKPLIHILQHWEWQAGEKVDVFVATNLDRVDLILNGKQVGTTTVAQYDYARFSIPFAQGELEARGWKDGKQVARHVVRTPGPAKRLRLTPSRQAITGDGLDAVPVMIELIDAKGVPIQTANVKVALTPVNGQLIGVGNGNTTSMASGKEHEVYLYNGLAQAILQTKADSTGKLSMIADSPGVQSAHVDLDIRPASVRKVAPGPLRFFIKGWRQSPISDTSPTSPEKMADNDMNSWINVSPGDPPPWSPKNGFLTLSASANLGDVLKTNGGTLIFQRVNGKGQLWLNGKLAATKTEPDGGELRAAIPTGAAKLDIALVLQAAPNIRTGLPGLVFVEPTTK